MFRNSFIPLLKIGIFNVIIDHARLKEKNTINQEVPANQHMNQQPVTQINTNHSSTNQLNVNQPYPNQPPVTEISTNQQSSNHPPVTQVSTNTNNDLSDTFTLPADIENKQEKFNNNTYSWSSNQEAIGKALSITFQDDYIVEAAKAYEEVISKGNGSEYVYAQLAEAYYNVFNTVDAEKWYAKTLETSEAPELIFKYAQMLKANGKYEDSNQQKIGRAHV